MGTLKGFASPFGPPPAASSPLASLGLANPSRALAPAGEARLRLRDHGYLRRVRYTAKTSRGYRRTMRRRGPFCPPGATDNL